MSAVGGMKIGRARPASSLAVLLASVLLVVMVVAIVPLAFAAHQPANSAFPIAFAPAFGAVGAVVALRQRRNPIGWILLAIAFFVGGSFDVETYTYLIYHVGDHGLPFGASHSPWGRAGIRVSCCCRCRSCSSRTGGCRRRAGGGCCGSTWQWCGHARDGRVAGRPCASSIATSTSTHPGRSGRSTTRADRRPRRARVARPVPGADLTFVVRQVLAFRASTGVGRQQLKSMLGGGAPVLPLSGLDRDRRHTGAVLVRRQQRRLSRDHRAADRDRRGDPAATGCTRSTG